MRRLLVTVSVILSLGFSASEWDCIKAVCGEARGEPYRGQVAVGEGIRNRKGLRGVYGARVNPRRITAWEMASCKRAWRESERTRISKGATVWGTSKDIESFKRWKWFREYEEAIKIGKHTFYKRKTGKRKR